MNKNFFLLLLLTMTSLSIFAQERLTGLFYNVEVKKASEEWKKNGSKDDYPPIQLPFYEDFSNYKGYPNPKYFSDRQAYVNNTFPVNPPTIGCVTLDALDENGEIYAHASADNFPADTLTSRSIRLDSLFSPKRKITPADSIYFSFYYQPGGATFSYPYLQWERVGNQPDRYDELILEFGYGSDDDNMVWTEVWSSQGESVDDWLDEDTYRLNYFKQVMIPIVDPIYLSANFKFRFRNYASLEGNGVQGWDGNCDQWHIDYIRLNVNRTFDDYYPDDIAFVEPTTSFLHTYQAMPWSHFRASYMKDNFENKLSNLSQVLKNSRYSYSVIKNGTEVLYQHPSSNENVEPYYNSGFQDYTLHATPAINFSLSQDNAESATFTVTHVYKVDGNSGDINVHNDTMVHTQHFDNYFAYDDGTAEAGYSIYSTLQNPQTYLAVRFQASHPDTLRAVKIWFNGVHNDMNVAPFTLMVWADNDGVPGEVIYEQPGLEPMHNADYYDFITYFLQEPIPIQDVFYVGIFQNHNVQLNIGFDQNNDAREHFLYKVTAEWREPYLKGAPMIRPVVGRYLAPVDISESHNNAQLHVYPNPTNDLLHVYWENGSGLASCSLFDMQGKLIEKFQMNDNFCTIDITDYTQGVYILKIEDKKNRKTIKVVKY